MPHPVLSLSGVQAAFDFTDVGTRKWDNEIEVLHNLGDGCMLKSVNRWKEVGSRNIRFLTQRVALNWFDRSQVVHSKVERCPSG